MNPFEKKQHIWTIILILKTDKHVAECVCYQMGNKVKFYIRNFSLIHELTTMETKAKESKTRRTTIAKTSWRERENCLEKRGLNNQRERPSKLWIDDQTFLASNL